MIYRCTSSGTVNVEVHGKVEVLQYSSLGSSIFTGDFLFEESRPQQRERRWSSRTPVGQQQLGPIRRLPAWAARWRGRPCQRCCVARSSPGGDRAVAAAGLFGLRRGTCRTKGCGCGWSFGTTERDLQDKALPVESTLFEREHQLDQHATR